MKVHVIRWLLILILVGQLAIPVASGGQIVSQAERDWAAQVLKRLEQDKVFPPPESATALGLLYFTNHSGRPELKALEKGLAAMLAADLAKVKKVRLVPRGRLQALMEALDLDVADLNDPVRMPRMGRLLGATYVLGGTIEKSQLAEMDIIPQLLEVPNDILLEQPLVTGDLTELSRLEKILLKGIIAKMGIQLSPQEQTAIEQPLSRNNSALNSYFRGLDQGDQGNYEAAFNLYEKALAEDPDLSLAESAKAELVHLGLVTAEGSLARSVPKAAPAPIPAEKPADAQPSAATPPPAPPAESARSEDTPAEGDSSDNQRRTLLIAGGAAAAAVAVIAVGSSSGGGSDDPAPDDPPPDEPDTPQITTTQPDNGTNGVPRDQTAISFYFSIAMDNTEGTVISKTPTWEVNTNASLEWSDDRRGLTLQRMDEEDLPSGDEIDLTLTGFVSEEGAALPDYTYSVTVEIY